MGGSTVEHYELLWIIAPTISLLLFFVFRIIAHGCDRSIYIIDWSHAYFFGAVGYFINNCRVVFGDIVSIPANICFGLVALFTARGLFRRYSGRSPDRLLFAIWFFTQFGGVWMALVPESVIGRGTAVGFGMALVLIMASRAVLQKHKAGTLDIALGLMTAAVAVLILLRPPLIVWLEGSQLSGTDLPTSFWLATHNIIAVTSWFVFAVLFAARIGSDLMTKLDQTAKTDPLSGLLNRRGFEEAFERTILSSTEGNSGLLLIFDIDHFKSFNDRFGHATGDDVIKAVAKAILGSCPPDALVARIGGEEFVAVLPDCPRAVARLCAENLRLSVQITGSPDVSRLGQVTVSIGATYLETYPNLSECLKHADRALYEAKASGRNRVRMADDVSFERRPPSDAAARLPEQSPSDLQAVA